MDPATAIGLVSGVIAIVQFGAEAAKKCRELSKFGSTEEQRRIRETTDKLRDAVARLKSRRGDIAVGHSTQLQQQEDIDIFLLAQARDETAGKLLVELDGLYAESKRQVPRKFLKAFFKNETLKNLKKELDRYTKTKDETILIRLHNDFTVLIDNFERLDEQGRCVARSLMKGHKDTETVISTLDDMKELIRVEQQQTREHVRCALQEQERKHQQEETEKDQIRKREKAKEENVAQIKKSLFYPEIQEREGNIALASPDTCIWMFQGIHLTDDESTPKDDKSAPLGDTDLLSDGDINGTSDGDANALGDCASSVGMSVCSDTKLCESKASTKLRGEQKLAHWLRKESGVFWISGKAGSEKSTLMRHLIANPFTKKCLTHWTSGSNLLVLKFFFWRPGHAILQKNLQGFLRSLLWQLIHLQPDLVSVTQADTAKTTNIPLSCAQMQTWTQFRLTGALYAFLELKPQDLYLCIFIDGLDEISESTSEVLEVIGRLARDPKIKLCVSSRPEQRFVEISKLLLTFSCTSITRQTSSDH